MHSVVKRQLVSSEASLLVKEMQEFPDIIYFSEEYLCRLPQTYVAGIDGQFAGVCGVFTIGSWIKIGPLVVLRQYQARGLGRALIDVIVQRHPDKNLLIMSSNAKVQKIVKSFHFTECESIFSLPSRVQLALARQLVHMLNFRLISEKIRKSMQYKRTPMRWYVRYNTA